MINVGIIGFGKMGQIRANAIEDSELGKINLIYDVSPIQNTNFTVASSPDEIINNKNIDAIFVCTPNYLNQSLTIQSLETGKHVFCEKPPAFNEKEVLEVIKAEKASGKKLMYGFNHRHHESIKMIKVLVENKRTSILAEVSKKYIELYNEAQGVKLAQVTTAVPLSNELEEKVLAKVKVLTGSDKVTLERKIDESIIGGFILRIGDLQYNASISNSLAKIKREFSKSI